MVFPTYLILYFSIITYILLVLFPAYLIICLSYFILSNFLLNLIRTYFISCLPDFIITVLLFILFPAYLISYSIYFPFTLCHIYLSSCLSDLLPYLIS